MCDQPHPLLVKKALHACIEADFQAANSIVEAMWIKGYCGLDMVGTLFRIVKFEPMDEALKLEFVKARRTHTPSPPHTHPVSCLAGPPSNVGAAPFAGDRLLPHARARRAGHAAPTLRPHREALRHCEPDRCQQGSKVSRPTRATSACDGELRP